MCFFAAGAMASVDGDSGVEKGLIYFFGFVLIWHGDAAVSLWVRHVGSIPVFAAGLVDVGAGGFGGHAELSHVTRVE